MDNILSSKVIDSCPINSTRRKIITLNFIRNGAGSSKSVHTTSSVGEPNDNGIILEIMECKLLLRIIIKVVNRGSYTSAHVK